ncbi:hypothetical protein ACIQCR_20995 [Streptomyces sp. NPDC093249]|uniref:hypothetical protein n=1 Tax=unclassified Streptomyces TaxID=2593676 RepID=UPI00344F99FB
MGAVPADHRRGRPEATGSRSVEDAAAHSAFLAAESAARSRTTSAVLLGADDHGKTAPAAATATVLDLGVGKANPCSALDKAATSGGNPRRRWSSRPGSGGTR